MLMRFCGWAGLGSLDSAYPYRRGIAFFALAATLGLLLFAGEQKAQAQGARAVESETRPVRHVSVTLFKSRTLRIEKPFATAIIGAPEIADILPMSDRSLYVQGKRIGTTNISIFDSSMQVIGVVDIEVTPDTGNLREKIDASTNGGSIRVSSKNGQGGLRGEARGAGPPRRAGSVAQGVSARTPRGKPARGGCSHP